jgi:hypothetical protein
MREVILRLVDIPIARMLVIAGFVFLLVGVLGKIEFKIEPSTMGRLSAALLGVLLLGIGVYMQYTELKYAEMHDAYNNAQLGRIADLPQSMVAASPVSAVINTETTAIKVVSGTYGQNCSAKPGNATAQVSTTCDGHSSCDFTIDTSVLEDPSPNCSKDFVAEWKCGSNIDIHSAALPSLTGKNDKLRLSCPN